MFQAKGILSISEDLVGDVEVLMDVALENGAEDFETIDVAIRVEEDADALLGEIGLRPLRRLSGVVVDAASQRVSGLVVTARPLLPTGSVAEVAAATLSTTGGFYGIELV